MMPTQRQFFFQLLSAIGVLLLSFILTNGGENESPTEVKQITEKESSIPSPTVSQAQRKPSQAGTHNITSDSLSIAHAELERTHACYASENCNFPKTDPKSYFFAVGQDLKRKLLKLHSTVIKNRIQSPLIEEIALKYLAVEDGHVKEAALHLLSSQPTNENSLEALLDKVIGYHDAALIQHAMLELQRYLGSEHETKIHEALINAIRAGSPFVSQEITKYIGPFINESSVDGYQKALGMLSPNTLSYKNLKTWVDEFRKLQTAA